MPEPRPAPVRVLHVPRAHGYVDHLHDDRVPGVLVVEDGTPDGPGWHPARALEADWVLSHAADFDVLHLHFGFEGRTPAQLRALVDALHRTGRSLVLTVHDLQNPHLRTQEGYTALLDVLVPAADGLVTLTPGAAAQVQDRWGRRPEVVPHPHVAPLARVGAPREPRSPRVVGVHLKSLRANLQALPVLRSLVVAARELTDGGTPVAVRVDVHAEALEEGFPRHDAELTAWLREAAAAGAVRLHVRDRFDDDELEQYLRDLDVSVLAYAHGTHSGWLELCHDLGTVVLAQRVGFLHEQQPLVEADLADPGAVAGALRRAFAGVPGSAATAGERGAQRLDVARAHEALYRSVVAAPGPVPGTAPVVPA
ncbi:glycosyltransferase family 1 protein [Kineococcus sp. TBRC 1896]|uniref:Glycosyltransferase family 1 protein n=1 Tax=Kineococcus mangrovi TaxID=1660183 RepID=A0ABV4HZW8_9ACTN